MNKPLAELGQSFSLLYHARRQIEMYPSKATDSDSQLRTGMHYFISLKEQLPILYLLSFIQRLFVILRSVNFLITVMSIQQIIRMVSLMHMWIHVPCATYPA